MKKFMYLIVLICVSCLYALSIEIGIQQGTGLTRIGFVDMNKLLSEYHKMIDAKAEYAYIKEQKSKALGELEESITLLKKKLTATEAEIEQLKAELTTLGSVPIIQPSTISPNIQISTPVVDTATITAVEQKINDKEKELLQIQAEIKIKEKELLEKKTLLDNEMAKFEQNKMNEILSEFYTILSSIAEEENIAIIIDKNGILYGQGHLDLTEKVRTKIRTR